MSTHTRGLFPWLVFAAVASTLALFASSALAQSLAQQLVGTWKITSGVMQVGNETKLTPLGANLVGMMIYTPEGHFCFTAMGANRPKLAGGDRAGGTMEQKAAEYESYRSFCGRYEVSEQERVITQSYDLSLLPDTTGTTEKRFILELSPTTLQFRTTAHVLGGKETFGIWTFQRAK
jgi:hypothetical protein